MTPEERLRELRRRPKARAELRAAAADGPAESVPEVPLRPRRNLSPPRPLEELGTAYLLRRTGGRSASGRCSRCPRGPTRATSGSYGDAEDVRAGRWERLIVEPQSS